MLTGIDHLVIATTDPDAAVDRLEREAGLAPGGGGRHEALGTFNRLVWLGDSYLELIGVFDPALAATSWIGRPTMAALAAGGGLATWACASDDLDDDVTRLRASGAGWVGPIDGERRRADGRVVRWRLAHPAEPGPGTPFLIEHDLTGAEWTVDDRAERARAVHPIGGRVSLVGLEVPVEPGPAAGSLGIGDQRVRFRVSASDAGSTTIVELSVDRDVPSRIVELPGVTVVIAPAVPR